MCERPTCEPISDRSVPVEGVIRSWVVDTIDEWFHAGFFQDPNTGNEWKVVGQSDGSFRLKDDKRVDAGIRFTVQVRVVIDPFLAEPLDRSTLGGG